MVVLDPTLTREESKDSLLIVGLSCFNDHKSLGYRSYLSVH